MYYPSIRGEDFADYAKKFTWNLLNPYLDSHSQRLIDEYPGDGVQAITVLQYQCENMTFSEKIRYNKLFQQVIHKGEESAINYIKIFLHSRALAISVGNMYSDDQLMHTFLDNFQKGGNCLRKCASTDHQSTYFPLKLPKP